MITHSFSWLRQIKDAVDFLEIRYAGPTSVFVFLLVSYRTPRLNKNYRAEVGFASELICLEICWQL